MPSFNSSHVDSEGFGAKSVLWGSFGLSILCGIAVSNQGAWPVEPYLRPRSECPSRESCQGCQSPIVGQRVMDKSPCARGNSGYADHLELCGSYPPPARVLLSRFSSARVSITSRGPARVSDSSGKLRGSLDSSQSHAECKPDKSLPGNGCLGPRSSRILHPPVFQTLCSLALA